MKEIIDIKIVYRYLINRLGKSLIILGFLSLITVCLFLLPYYHLPVDQIPIELNIILIVSLLTIIIGLIFKQIRKYESAKIIFDAKSLNIISNKQNVTIQFDKIDKFLGTDINAQLDEISFAIITKDSLTYEIKADKEVYEGLIALFPGKE